MPVTSEELADVEWGLETLKLRLADYLLYQRYYDGDHRLLFATEKFRNAFGPMFAAMADNLCPTVVDTLADRLTVTGFSSANQNASQAAWDLWVANRMDRRAGENHAETFKAGDGYLIVWPDITGRVRLWPQRAGNCCVRYSEEQPDIITLGFKRWKEGKRWRVNLYYPDRIRRLITKTDIRQDEAVKAEAFTDLPENANLPSPYDKAVIFHFANNAPMGDPGRSELRDVIPLQDALNKAVADMLVAMEFHAFPQRYVTGLQPETDDEGRPKPPPFSPGADRLWAALGENVKFGQFDPAQLDGFLKVQESFRLEIARVSGTPVHWIAPGDGTPPSGEALRVAEGRLVAKAKDRQVAFGNVWEDAMKLALRMTPGTGISATENLDISCEWEPPETQNERLEAETQEIKQRIGVSKRQSLRELGYSDDEIDTMQEDRQAEATTALEAQAMAFNQGMQPPAFS